MQRDVAAERHLRGNAICAVQEKKERKGVPCRAERRVREDDPRIRGLSTGAMVAAGEGRGNIVLCGSLDGARGRENLFNGNGSE